MSEERTTRHFSVKIPEDLVTVVKKLLKTHGMSWNQFITEAITEKAEREARVQALRETRGILGVKDAPEWTESPGAEWVQKVRSEERSPAPWAT